MKSDNYNENNNNNDNNSNDNQATQTGSTLKFQLGPSLGWLKINKAVSFSQKQELFKKFGSFNFEYLWSLNVMQNIIKN